MAAQPAQDGPARQRRHTRFAREQAAAVLTRRLRTVTDLPICVGTGVSDANRAAEVARFADGVGDLDQEFVQHVEAVVISHEHYDHCDLDALLAGGLDPATPVSPWPQRAGARTGMAASACPGAASPPVPVPAASSSPTT